MLYFTVNHTQRVSVHELSKHNLIKKELREIMNLPVVQEITIVTLEKIR